MKGLLVKFWPLLTILGLMFWGGYLRLYNLSANYSFWTDENHAAIFARAIVNRGEPVLENGYSTGAYQIVLYYLMAGFMTLFGVNEFSARLPSILFGILTIPATYLLAKTVFGRKAGLFSTFFAAFLQIEILWSRQARPYQGLQLCYLLASWLIYRLVNQIGNKKWNFVGFVSIGIFAAGLHGLGAIIIPAGLLLLAITKWQLYLKEIGFISFLVFVIYVLYRLDGMDLVKSFGSVNNIYYYRYFLTYNYLLLLIIALIGLLGLIIEKKSKQLLFFASFCLPQIFMVFFILSQPFLRYFYIIMPFLYILAGYGLVIGVRWLVCGVQKITPKKPETRHQTPNTVFTYLLFVIVTIVVIWSLTKSDKLVLLPRPYYSLNNDMQEIPEVDWKKIYSFVGREMSKDNNSILITNWNDQPIWYFGEDSKDKFVMVRKPEPGKSDIDSYGERIIYSLNDLNKLVTEHSSGLVIVDSWDNYVPGNYHDFLRNNLQLVMEVDRLYTAQPRYWTVWVWKWGTMENQ